MQVNGVEGPLIGRDSEIEGILKLLANKKSVTLIIGEAGIGKSAILQEFRRRLWEEYRKNYFVGYYDQSNELKSASSIYPFLLALKHFLEWIAQTESFSDRIKETLGRLESAFIKFLKEKGTEMAGAIIQDIAEKVGLRETLRVAKEFLTTVKAEQSAIMLAESYVNEHKKESICSYIDIFKSLKSEFKDQHFVLVFDQFESVGKSSIDFLIDFIRNVPDQFHLIISFRSEENSWEDVGSKKLYEYATDLIEKEGAKVITIGPLSVEAIGKWIRISTGTDLPLIPDLKRIRENTGGFPLLLREWIEQSKSISYEALEKFEENADKRKQLCKYIIQRKNMLYDDKDSIKRLNRISVLTRPLQDNELAKFLAIEKEDLEIFLDKLVRHGIFEKKNNCLWFRHELVQRCLEESLTEEYKYDCHQYAASFYVDQFIQGQNTGYISNNVFEGCAYHLFKSGQVMQEQSLFYNKDLAQRAAAIGDLDLAERCYRRAIKCINDEKHLDDFFECYLGLAHAVLTQWGRYDEARTIYRQLLKNSIRNSKIQLLLLLYTAQLHYIFKEYDRALEVYDQTYVLAKESDNQQRIAESLHGAALVFYHKKEYHKALTLFKQSLSIEKILGNKIGEISCHFHISNIYRIEKKYDDAIKLLTESALIAKDIGSQPILAEILHGMSNIYYDKKEYDNALNLLNERLSIEEKIGNQAGIAVTLLNIGKIFMKRKSYNEALSYSLRAHSMLKKLNLPDSHLAEKDLNSIKTALKTKSSGKLYYF